MNTAHFTACPRGRVWTALDNHTPAPITLPRVVTFTDDTRRAVTLPDGFCVRKVQ